MRKQQIKTPLQRSRVPAGKTIWHVIAPRKSVGWRAFEGGLGIFKCRNGHVFTLPGSESWSFETAVSAAIDHWSSEDAAAASYAVETAIRDYAKHQRLHKGTRASLSAHNNCTRALRPYLTRELASITKVELTELHASWVRGDTPDKVRASKASANRLLAAVKACFNVAHKSDKVSDNFWSGVEAFKKVDGARSLFLTKQQVADLLHAADGAIHDLIQGCVLTGMRMGEARSCCVADVDLGNNTLHLNGKTGERDVQMSHAVRQHVETLIVGKSSDAPVWAAEDGREWKPGSHSRPFFKAAQAAGLPKETVLYSTRHYHISQCLKAGLPILAVAKATGTSVAMIESTYGKFQPNTMMELLNSVTL
jgi:integrase